MKRKAEASHGVELPPDFPVSTSAAEVAALLESYFGQRAVPAPVRKLVARAVLLRRDWLAGEALCIERHVPEDRHGTPERIASEASRRAMVLLMMAAREIAALTRH